jgi:glycosyltransferase involved in cell wall biosynthesis
MPKLSIITPCYNSESFIGQTIQSVQEQTFQDWEHIVVNDGSLDLSQEVVEKLILSSSSSKLRLINQSNSGVARTRNTGYENISDDSQYLFFLDSDDFLKPEMLSIMVNYLDDHPDLGFIYCSYTYADKNGKEIDTPKFFRYVPTTWSLKDVHLERPETSFSEIFNYAPILPSVCIIRRSIYEKTERWNEEIGQPGEDTNLFLNLSLQANVHFINQSLVYYRRHDNQSISNEKNFWSQHDKLYHLWATRNDLTKNERKLVDEAIKFRNERLEAFTGFNSANYFLKQRKFFRALKFYAGAFRRYVKSFV